MSLIALALTSSALAYESTPQDVHFHNEVELFNEIEMGTGWQPADSPVQFGLFLKANGGAVVDMDGVSHLTWPTALTHTYESVPDSGMLVLNNELELTFDMRWDLDIGISGEEELGGRGITFTGATPFQPFALLGGPNERVEVAGTGVKTEVFTWDYEVIAGVEIYFDAEVYPEASAAFEGRGISTDGQVVEYEGVSSHVEPQDDGKFEAFAIFTGWYETALSIVVAPSFGVCVDLLGCEEVARFDLPLDIVSTDFEVDFSPVPITHPLPWLFGPTDGHDFGDVEVGQIRTWELSFENLGDLELEGDLRVDGGGEFTVFPDEIYAGPSGADGLTVTFAPTGDGQQIGELVLLTNDPATPELVLPLSGNGWVEGSEGDTSTGDDGTDGGVDGGSNDLDGGTTTIPAEVGCNCASAGTRDQPAGALVALGLLGAVALRRRR